MHSMRINGAWHPRSSAFSVLQLSVRLAATSVPGLEDNALCRPLAKSGSATLIRWGDKRYVICTPQQKGSPGRNELDPLKSLTVSSMRQAFDAGNTNRMRHIPFVRCHLQMGGGEGEHGDLLFLEVANHYDGLEDDRPCFIDLAEDAGGEVERSIAIGILTTQNSINCDSKAANIRSFSMYCYEDLKFAPSAQFLRRYTYIGPDNLDGLNGGAVFSLRKASKGTCARFEGIVTRGGNGFLHVISADYLRLVLPEVGQNCEAVRAQPSRIRIAAHSWTGD